MVSVKINNQPLEADLGSISTVPDLVEFVKTYIDPESIITGLFIDGRPLAEGDWRVPLNVFGTSVFEVCTGSKEEYLSDRMSVADEYLEQIIAEFTQAREFFKKGSSLDGNRSISNAVNDLNAFLNWYNTLLNMLPAGSTSCNENFLRQVEELSHTCEQLVQQQLYNSWWALGETMETKLEPQLGLLRESCRTIAAQKVV